MSIGIVVQARTKSTRFPNKVFYQLSDKKVIEHIIEECVKVKNTKTFIAVPSEDVDAFKFLCPKYGISVFGGDEKNVLCRYYSLVSSYKLETIIRITGDCPCINAKLIENIITFYRENDFDYCSNMTITHATSVKDAHNHTSDTFLSDGFSCEIFSVEALKQAFYNTTDEYGKEHVTSWIKNNLNCGLYDKGFVYLHGKFSLDEQSDLEAIEAFDILRRKGFIKYGEK